jgi:hypothetical protein
MVVMSTGRFMKADDDTYVVVKNLRAFLSQHSPTELHYYGARAWMCALGESHASLQDTSFDTLDTAPSTPQGDPDMC